MHPIRTIASLPFSLFVRVVILLAFSTTSAQAQQYILRMPQAISGDEVELYFKELNCSREQQLAIVEFHREYTEAYANWMAGDQVPDTLWLRPYDIETPTADKVAEYQRYRVRAEALDASFFARLQAILTLDQARLIPGVQQLRENNRLRQVVYYPLYVVPPAGIDLQLLLADLPSREPQDAAEKAILNEYRIASTRILREIDRLTLEFPIKVAEAWLQVHDLFEERLAEWKAQAESGDIKLEQLVRHIHQRHQELVDFQQRMTQNRKMATDHARRDVLLEACKLSDLNRRYFQVMKGVLADELFREMLLKYHGKGYRGIPSARGRADEVFIAIQNENTSQSIDAESLAEMSKAYRGAIDETLNQMRLRIDKDIRKQIQESQKKVSQTTKAHDRVLETWSTRYDQINKQALLDLNESSLVTDTVLVRKLLQADPEPPRRRLLHWSSVSSIARDGHTNVSNRKSFARSDEHWEQFFEWKVFPRSIPLENAIRMAKTLGGNEEMRPVLELLHQDYRFDWVRALTPMLELIREYKEAYHMAMDGGENHEELLLEQIDVRYDMYKELLRVFEELDEAFIDNIAALQVSETQPLLGLWKQSRQLEVLRPAILDGTADSVLLTGLRIYPSSGLMIDRSGPLRTDLFLLLLEEYVPASWINDETLDAVSAYYDEAIPLVSSIHASSVNSRQYLEKIYIEQMSLGGDEFRASERDAPLWSETGGRLCLESEILLNLDRKAMDQVQGTMIKDVAEGNELYDRYLARAFPKLTPNPKMEDEIRKALANDAIDENQRSRIEKVYITYMSDSRRDTLELLHLAMDAIMQNSCDRITFENATRSMSFRTSQRETRARRKLRDSNAKLSLSVILGETP